MSDSSITELQLMENVFCHPQPVPEAAGEVLASENISQNRLKLLASLLRAIEETNGGTLSHLEDPQEKDDSPQQPPSHSGEMGNSLFSHFFNTNVDARQHLISECWTSL